jgi:hypothetical protein
VLQLLRDAKANLETPNNYGCTPALIAAYNGHIDVLQLLHDAEVNLENSVVVSVLSSVFVTIKIHIYLFFLCIPFQVDGCSHLLFDVAEQFGYSHIVAFLEGLSPRSAGPMPRASLASSCKPTTSDKRECANCGVGAGDRSVLLLKACSRCKLVFYCSESCQRQHWKKGEHKRFCVAVGDRKLIKSDMIPEDAQPIDTKPAKACQLKGVAVSSKECAVCLEPLNLSITCTLACGHIFHRDCIAGVQSFGLSQKCPMCRRSGISEDID